MFTKTPHALTLVVDKAVLLFEIDKYAINQTYNDVLVLLVIFAFEKRKLIWGFATVGIDTGFNLR